MDRRSSSLVGTAAALAALALAAPAAPAQAPKAPTLLPAVTRALDAAQTTGRTCTDAATAATAARGLDGATYRAPMSGFLTVRLAGKGDWDLVVQDAASGQPLAASQGFGGREVAQTWVEAGQRIVADGCRRAGAGKAANVRFTLADVKPPTLPQGAPRLVRVEGTADQLHGLERMGFDVTHNMGRGWADVIVSGAAQAAQLASTKLETTVRDANLTRSFLSARAADEAYAKRVGAKGSPLPSGRTDYRTYDEIQAELKALVAEHPDTVRKVTFGTTFQGREISGVEIAQDVNADDGRPVFFLMGNHHAREWPSAEAPMELAHLLVSDGGARVKSILQRERVVILPVVNVDGFISSRGAFDPIDTLLGSDSPATVVNAIAPPGGIFAYRRKNCDGEILPPETPCELAWGVDNNRNYGNLWGGPGSSADVTSQSYHGPGPRSEPETQAVWNYARTHHVTTLVSLHTVAALVLRPPGLSGSGLAPDEDRMREIGDAMGKAAGYTSQYSWELYDTAGTTEDDTYAATGGYGYTIEMGPPDGQFHEPYEKGVIAEWTGANDHAKGAGGLREALLIAAEAAADPKDHAVVTGTAPAGKVLRLKKSFPTTTSPYCEKGIEPVVNLAALGGGGVCLGAEKPPVTLTDTQDTTTKVPASGSFEWHVGQSTRPFVAGGATTVETKDAEQIASAKGAPNLPNGTATHDVQYAGGAAGDGLRFKLTSTLPEDYDIEVLKDGKSVGTSGNLPGAVEEVLVENAAPGTYQVKVSFYAALTGQYEVTATRVTTTRTTTPGTKEAYELTCEEPDGTVLERRTLQIDRGQQIALALGCGGAPTTLGDGSPAPDALVAGSAPAQLTVASSRTAATTAKSPARKAPARAAVTLRGASALKVTKAGAVRIPLACPATVTAACKGTVTVKRGSAKLGSGRFTLAAGKAGSATVKLTRAGLRGVRSGTRVKATAVVSGTAGATKLTGSRSLTLRK